MEIYLATVALEKNRWSTHEPSFEVSSFLPGLRQDGFAGIELWENHFFKASAGERERLAQSGVPVIFNTYARFDGGVDDRLREVASAVRTLNAHAVKFNLARSDAPLSQQLDTLRQFAAMLPANVLLLSECHPGTLMEEPQDAQRILDRLPADRFGAIVHLFPVKGDNARRFELYGDRILHLHTQIRKPGTDERTRLDAQRGVSRDLLCALRAWEFAGSVSIEFTQEGASPEETYRNCVADLCVVKEALA